MKKILTSVMALTVMAGGASAGLVSTYYDMGNLNGSVTITQTQALAVSAGDVVVMVGLTNKKNDVVPLQFSSTAGTLTDVRASAVLGANPNPDTDILYQTIAADGTYDFTAWVTASCTMNVGLYVLSADSGSIQFLDNDALEYSGYATLSETFSVTNSMSWAGNANYGQVVAIGGISSLKGNVAADTLNGILDEDNSAKRLLADVTLAAGTTSYDIAWDGIVANTTESGSAVSIAFAEVIPEPATLGFVAFSGLAIVFIRRRFMI